MRIIRNMRTLLDYPPSQVTTLTLVSMFAQFSDIKAVEAFMREATCRTSPPAEDKVNPVCVLGETKLSE